jgi:predicted SAM-dependent methyltransferase
MKLHLGCGAIIKDGWINIDERSADHRVMLSDLRGELPFTSDKVDFIYSEHFWEHLTREYGQRLAWECWRVLKPGGVLRISTPCLKTLLDDYDACKLDRISRDVWAPASPARMLNEAMRLWGHEFIYDEDEMFASLAACGFRDIQTSHYGFSPHEALVGAESRPNDGEALIVEATK